MKKHELKTTPNYFKQTWAGKKLYEIRKNDRDFKIGDLLVLKEYYPTSKQYSGRKIFAKITQITNDPLYCLPGYVILGITLNWVQVDQK